MSISSVEPVTRRDSSSYFRAGSRGAAGSPSRRELHGCLLASSRSDVHAVTGVVRVGCPRLSSRAPSATRSMSILVCESAWGRRVVLPGSLRAARGWVSCAGASVTRAFAACLAGHLHLHTWSPAPVTPDICICSDGLPRPLRRTSVRILVDGRIRLAEHPSMLRRTGASVVYDNLTRRTDHMDLSRQASARAAPNTCVCRGVRMSAPRATRAVVYVNGCTNAARNRGFPE